MNRSFIVLALVLVLGSRVSAGVVAQEVSPTTGGDLANLVLPPDAPAYGLTYEVWTARFAQWRHSLPMAIDPGADPTGERCGYGQTGPVFFLVQAGEDAAARTCTIPRGPPFCSHSWMPPVRRSSRRPSSGVMRPNCGPAPRRCSPPRRS